MSDGKCTLVSIFLAATNKVLMMIIPMVKAVIKLKSNMPVSDTFRSVYG